MADASYLQTSFLGGEWSPLIQGRMDDQRYRTALNVCRNTIPIEEGSATRRPGIRLIAPMRAGQPGVLRQFHFAQSHPYSVELTANHLRLIAGAGLVVESSGTQAVVAVSAANPGVITTGGAHGWSSGDQVQVQLDPADLAAGNVNPTVAPLLGRELGITVASTTTFSVFDALTGVSIDCTGVALGTSNLSVSRIADFGTSYAAVDLQAINTVQGQTNALGNFLMLLHPSYPPAALTSTSIEQGTTFAAFAFNPAVAFTDGPYLDVPTANGLPDGSTVTPSAVSGSITLTLTPGSTAPSFAPTDVGRAIRIFSEPAAWSATTNYAVGAQVQVSGAYFQALAANIGKDPTTDVINWAVATTAAVWMWGKISAVADATHVTVTLNPVTANGTVGPAVLPRLNACTFRLGVFSDTTGYPACGCYHEGRLWLAGAQPNRFDASVSNSPFDFTPTASDGTVADNNGISGVFNADDSNVIVWMIPDKLGIIGGSQAGEWLISASSTNDPITPTSIQAHRQTKFGCANTPAFRTGLSICFVQRYNKKVLEYITTDFRGLAAKNISITGKHLTAAAGIAELAYTREKTPVLWARTTDGRLLGCSYRREGAYASDPPDFAAWHRHDLGNGMTVTSIQGGPNFDGSLDALSMVLTDGTLFYSALLTDYFDTDWQIADSMFVDFAVTPKMWQLLPNNSAPTSIRLYSLHRLAGKTVDVFLAGIDYGQLTVAADGHLDIPVNGTSGAALLATTTYLQGLVTANNFHGLGMGFLIAQEQAAIPVLTGIAQITSAPITGYQPGTQLIDWDSGLWYVQGTDAGSVPQEVKMDIRSRQAIFSSPNIQGNGGQSVLDRKGNFYSITNAFNQGQLHKYDKKFNHVADFGLASSNFTSDATHLQLSTCVASIGAGSTDFLIGSALIINEITFFNLTTMQWAGANYTLDEGRRGQVCAGRSLSGYGEAFAAAAGAQDGNPGPNIGVYRFVVTPTGLSFKQTATKITAAQMTAATGVQFTHFNQCGGMVFDASDNTIILDVLQGELNISQNTWNAGIQYSVGQYVVLSGHDFQCIATPTVGVPPTSGGDAFWADRGAHALTHNVMLKVNPATGAILWTVMDVHMSDNDGNNTWHMSRIRGGILVGWDGSSTTGNFSRLMQINTKTGVAVELLRVQFMGWTQQWYNDETGQLLFSNTGGGTAPLVPMFGLGASIGGNFYTLGPAAGAPFWPPAAAPAAATFFTIPVAIGFSYPSQGQILRPINPQEAGARNGPALAKTRRTHQLGALVQQTQGIKFGTVFSNLHTAELTSPGGAILARTLLFSGVWWDSLEDDYSFDSMVCWEIDRPYPATVCALGPFLHTQDR